LQTLGDVMTSSSEALLAELLICKLPGGPK